MTSVVVDDEAEEDGLKMTISTDNCVDVLGRYVPAGNYYFTATQFLNNLVVGTLFQRGEWGEFCFESKQLIRMMAVAQARLNRRVTTPIQDERMPRYTSPPTSPIRTPIRIPSPPPRPPPPPLPPPRPPSPIVCSICYDGIQPAQEKRLPCQHVFHASCIDTWLLRKPNCPLCRAQVPRLPRIAARHTTTTRRPPYTRSPMPPPSQNLRIRSMAYDRYRDRYRRRNGSIL